LEGWFFVRADDDAGDKWLDPVLVQEDLRKPELKLINGYPAICDGTHYAQAMDLRGTAWGDVVNTSASESYQSSLAEIDGKPAVAAYQNTLDDLYYSRALDSNGETWPIVPVVVEFIGSVGNDPELIEAKDLPAIAYYDATFNALKFIRALNPDGSAWKDPQVLDVLADGVISVTLLDDRPAIVYSGRPGVSQDYLLKFIAANNSEGTSWGLPMVLDPTADVNAAESPCFTTVSGIPGVSYVARRQHELELMYAAYAIAS
jgi:hypothetical protein